MVIRPLTRDLQEEELMDLNKMIPKVGSVIVTVTVLLFTTFQKKMKLFPNMEA